jgi:hypothetical protein
LFSIQIEQNVAIHLLINDGVGHLFFIFTFARAELGVPQFSAAAVTRMKCESDIVAALFGSGRFAQPAQDCQRQQSRARRRSARSLHLTTARAVKRL